MSWFRRPLLGLLRCAVSGLALGAASACSEAPLDPPAVRSCRGERVLECDPYEWAVATAGSITPAELPIGDPRIRPTFSVDFESCGGTTPSPPTVQVVAVLSDDAGATSRTVALTTLRAASATDTHIEVTVDNPFTLSVPPNTNMRLRFLPVVGGCDGEAFEIPYRSGPPFP